MRTLLVITLFGVAFIWLSGCGATLLLHVYTVSDGPPSRVLARNDTVVSQWKPLGGVKFFFFPYVRDKVIHEAPERDFVTDSLGRADYTETVSPMGDKEGALIGMKSGYLVDTLFFPFGLDDTVGVVVRMRPRASGD